MSDELREQAERNKILEIVAGSQLYGTATPTSDKDYVGIFIPPVDYILGLKSVEEVDLGIKDKGEDRKNTINAVDRKLYEFRKFLNLALGSNPNIIEILFAPEHTIQYINDYGKQLLSLRHSFISKLCIPKFIGYAHSQKHKMIIRSEHFLDLKAGYEILCEINDTHMTMETVQAKYPNVFSTNLHHVKVGDLNIERGVYVKKARSILQERLSKITNRSELVLKHGYDVKFASHLIRLLTEGITLLRYGELSFPLPNANTLLTIKNGQWSVDNVIRLADELEAEIDGYSATTKIPAHPNYKVIEAFCISTMDSWIRNTHKQEGKE